MIKVGKVGMIPVESVVVEDRAREEMGDLEGLEDSIKESGLISPLAVRDNGDGTYKLLAGERRFTVLKKNNVKEIPVRIFDKDLTKLEMKVIEKSENFYRKDMEWWELDKLTLEIHELQQSIHGKSYSGPKQGWSMDDTSKLIGTSKANVSMAIKRAKAMETFPEVFKKCKTKSDAMKALKKIDEAVVKQTIAKKVEKSNSNTTLSKLARSFIIKDVFEGVKEIPDNVFHLVEIDPPYAIDLERKKKADSEISKTTDFYNEVPGDSYPEFLFTLFKECYRVMAQHSWLICWFAPEPWFEIVYQLLIKAGFETRRMCGVWVKGYGQSMRPEIHLANSYEMFFYAWKGRPALNKSGRANTFNFPPVPAQQKIHPTERPIELTTEIYDTFAFPGSRIFIPFLGSGNGLISAYNLGMTATGFELSQQYKDSFLVKINSLFKN